MTLTDVIFFLREKGFQDASKALEEEIESTCICYRTDNQLICPTCKKEKKYPK